MGLFDIIGPVMIGPSSSHTAGAARIGKMAREILGEDVKTVHITLYGSFAKTGKGHGTDKALIAGLMDYNADSTVIRTSFDEATKKGIDFSFSTSSADMGHPNVAKIDAVGVNGRKVSVVGRSLGGGRILITNIDGYPVAINGENYTLMTVHSDVPGIVADVSRILGDRKINISTMRLFRKGRGKEAVMIIHTDQPVDKDTVKAIYHINDHIHAVQAMDKI